MSRRRSIPWIHQWSRPIIGAIAGFGALTTAYLTVVKLSLNTAACPTESCDLVLSSPYAEVFGQPLALFGFLAYVSMLIFALAPLAVDSAKNKALNIKIENTTWLLLLAGAIAMTVFSSYLMYLLAFELKALCIYCLASALFSLTLLVLTIVGRTWEDIGQIFFTAIVVGMITLIGTLGAYAGVNGAGTATNSSGQQVAVRPVTQPTPGIGWEITTVSGASEIALARHLTQSGAKEYIAWWCPHCHEQKLLFGKEAYKEITHVECAEGGIDPRPDLCKTAKIESFPTWEIKGKLYPGVKSLNELADLTSYTGDRNFTIVAAP
jgi:uncharacterized membrane protein